ncbi:hypothetical protein V6N13_133479 [Hibiscus sabdariffa]|uniref:Uncharacterized protein n=1 Tax=Hibiscus sabdariffa TaxID=183260 RepID=A0ABR2CJA7_9ROSI
MGSAKPGNKQIPRLNPKPFGPSNPKFESKFKKKRASTTKTKNSSNRQNKTKSKTVTGNNKNPSMPMGSNSLLSNWNQLKELDQDVMKLEKHIKEAFGAEWKEELCEGKLIEAGTPAVLVVAPSALRSVELLRGMCSLTKECLKCLML